MCQQNSVVVGAACKKWRRLYIKSAAPTSDMLQLVTFLTFNVLFPSELPYAITAKLQKIAQIVVNSNCTVAIMQELQGYECELLRHLDALEPGAWNRADGTAIFAKLPLVCAYSSNNKFSQAAELVLDSGHRVRVINAHWWPSEYAVTLLQQSLLGHTDNACAARTDVPFHLRNRSKHGECYGFRTAHRRPADSVALADAAGATVVVAGDFNEPSHLDWSERYQAEGKNRWSGASVPLKQAVAFPGSRLMETHGFADAYRSVYPDEVRFPGDTVTPPYNQSKWLNINRGPWRNQVQARIDRIYFRPGTDAGIWAVAATVIGEATVDNWPSDHRAVAAALIFETEPSAAGGGCPGGGEWHPGAGVCGPPLIVYLSVGLVLAALVNTAAGSCSSLAKIRNQGCRRPSCDPTSLMPWKRPGYAAVTTAAPT